MGHHDGVRPGAFIRRALRQAAQRTLLGIERGVPPGHVSEALARLAHEDHGLREEDPHRLEHLLRLLLGVPLEIETVEAGHGHLDRELDRVVRPHHSSRFLHVFGQLLEPAPELLGIPEKALERVFR